VTELQPETAVMPRLEAEVSLASTDQLEKVVARSPGQRVLLGSSAHHLEPATYRVPVLSAGGESHHLPVSKVEDYGQGVARRRKIGDRVDPSATSIAA
jgi:hypothetical protein